MDFSLSIDNIKNIPFQKYENNFTFIVDGKKYKSNRLIADLLSPTIRNYHFSDQLINEFTIDTSYFKDITKIPNENNYFEEFLTLSSFSDKKIDQNCLKYFLQYFIILGNVNEVQRIKSYFLQNLTIDNAIDQLLLFIETNTNEHKLFDFDQNQETIENIIQFIAKNFELIDKKKLKLLDIDVLEIILHHNSLKLQNEDSLLEFILSLYKKDRLYFPLFECIIFSNVTKERFERFLDEFEFGDLNLPIWHSICECIKHSKFKKLNLNDDNRNNRYLDSIKTFNFEKENELDGILRYLTKITGGNIHDNGTIKINSNSILNDDPICGPKNLVDYENDNFYQSKDQNGSFIIFDFIEKSVNLDCYTIKNGKSLRHYYLKNWVIEGSNDENQWDEIDRHVDDSKLDADEIAVTFDVQKKNAGFYRFIRLRETGQTWSQRGSHFSFWFPFIEFYGDLKFSNH